jgi:broad-specificity NMP kinase
MQKIYFISGVCGVGKTSTLKHLKNILDTNLYDVRDLDERGVPDGGGFEWLNTETRYWLDVAQENALQGKSTIICGFADPELFEQVYKKDIDIPAQIILLNASSDTIRARLEGRHTTPESIAEIERASGVSLNQFIENNTSFATQFKTIFETRNLSIIETDDKTPKEVTREIIKIVTGE